MSGWNIGGAAADLAGSNPGTGRRTDRADRVSTEVSPGYRPSGFLTVDGFQKFEIPPNRTDI